MLATNRKEIKEVSEMKNEIYRVLQDTEQYLVNISYQSNMLLTLINDLLDLAKFETMNFTFNEQYFDLEQLINQAFDTVKYQAA